MNNNNLVVLRLYTARHAPNSMRAIVNLYALCQQYLTERHQIEVIDVLEEPARALGDGILVTPTLVRLFPEPMMYIIGDLSETAKILTALNLERLDGAG
jgi:circadian clock protein KaiB